MTGIVIDLLTAENQADLDRCDNSFTRWLRQPPLPGRHARDAGDRPVLVPVIQGPTGFALHRAAFGTAHMTVAERLTWMRMPDYDPASIWWRAHVQQMDADHPTHARKTRPPRG